MSHFDFNTPNQFTALGKRTINNYVFELFALIQDTGFYSEVQRFEA